MLNGNIGKNIFKITFFIFLLAIQLLFSFPVLAQDGTTKLVNPLGGSNANPQGDAGEGFVSTIGSSIIKTTLGVLGSITLLVFIIGGFMWLTSGGNQDKVQMGSKTMLYASIGIFVIFASYAILSLIIKGLTTSG